MTVGVYDLLLLAHVLLFVYWLGADLAVLYSARYVADPRLSLETRETVSQIMAFVDLFPRMSVPLIGAVGATLGVMNGDFSFGPTVLTGIWVLALIWVGLNGWLYLNRGDTLRTAPWRRFDVAWRSVIGIAVLIAALVALAGIGVTDNRTLAAKLLIFAAAIFLSLVLRRVFLPFRPALRRLAEGTGGSADVAIMQQTLSRTRPIVLGIWALTVVAAALGLWQPF
ncbi:MAG: hypothetical protein JJT93_15210 [Gammaproteobacteria bacterium]|nr:hypothetical protein [Gammaproteobacteria bacterium]